MYSDKTVHALNDQFWKWKWHVKLMQKKTQKKCRHSKLMSTIAFYNLYQYLSSLCYNRRSLCFCHCQKMLFFKLTFVYSLLNLNRIKTWTFYKKKHTCITWSILNVFKYALYVSFMFWQVINTVFDFLKADYEKLYSSRAFMRSIFIQSV